MTQQHPITPPPELVGTWVTEAGDLDLLTQCNIFNVATRAAQWGADTELDSSNSWLVLNGYGEAASRLRAARRPKPPNLKEQAQDSLQIIMKGYYGDPAHADLIRRALEQLPDHE